MRVLVCGSRTFSNRALMDKHLSKLNLKPGDVVIEGEARGADLMARGWAEDHDISVEDYPADWKKYGRRAGSVRNKQMLVEGKPDLVIAFFAGPEKSPGTSNMVRQSREAGIRAIEVVAGLRL